MGMCSGQVEAIGECLAIGGNLPLENAMLKHPTREIVSGWQVEEVVQWASKNKHLSAAVVRCLQLEDIDGQALLNLTEDDIRDLRYRCHYNLRYGEMKKLWHYVTILQGKHGANEQICHHHINKSKFTYIKSEIIGSLLCQKNIAIIIWILLIGILYFTLNSIL